MQIADILHTAQVTVHWDHIVAPNDPKAGLATEDSYLGLAKRVAGIVLFVLSTKLINFKRSLILFGLGGAYHFYKAYQKVTKQPDPPPPPRERTQEEIDRANQIGLDAILHANRSGKKMGLIIGREKDQPVPKEDGWLWVSGNIDGETEVLEDRVHFQMDFNDSEACEKIKQLFDTVVVDYSTLKFIHNPWMQSKKLLKPAETTQLITETWRSISLSPNVNAPYFRPEDGQITLPLAQSNDDRIRNEAIAAIQAKTKEFLQKHFHSVELRLQAPYPTRETLHPHTDDIFVLTHPKKT